MNNCSRPRTQPTTAADSASHDDTMNQTTGGRRRWCRARPWQAGVLAVAAGLVLLTAACGGSPPSSGSPSSSHHPSASGTGHGSFLADELAFSRCVRAHGVPNFPDPRANGQASASSKQVLASNPQSPAAVRACVHLLPIGHGQAGGLTAQQQQDYLRAVACMRSHGVAGFPDPVFSGGSVSFPIPSSIDTSSERFAQARQTCARLIPAGLPFSSESGGSGG